MKKELSSLDIHFILGELKYLIGAKIDKIYQPEKEELTLSFHVPSVGKRILNILLPGLFFISEFKKEQPERPSDFCMFLRKRLANARLRDIEQHESERVVVFTFENKESKFLFILELFSTGNVILCDSEFKTLRPLKTQIWKDREIKSGKKYEFPKKGINLFELDETTFSKIIKASKRHSFVKSLAMELGLGGLYAEELCVIADIDKDKKSLDNLEIKKAYSAFKELIEKKPNPVIIKEENDVEILPFEFKSYDCKKQENSDSINLALASIFIGVAKFDSVKKKTSSYDKSIEKLEWVIQTQEKAILDMNISSKENTEKGEALYTKYALVNDILNELKIAAKKMPWSEIKKKLKGHAVIKEINEKECIIILDL